MITNYPRDDQNGVVLERYLPVKAAAKHFGYNGQYLRRLLRTGRLEGVRIGQVWLIKMASLEAHLHKGYSAEDQRYGPQGLLSEAEQGVSA